MMNTNDIIDLVNDFNKLDNIYQQIDEFNSHEFQRDFYIAESSIRNTMIPYIENYERPKSIAIIGGTNVGKSTITNAILGKDYAGANVVSAYTRNAAAFVPESIGIDNMFGDNQYAFYEYEKQDYMSEGQLGGKQYFVQAVDEHALGDVVIWDTPDVDSTKSNDYLPSVIEAATFVDLIVYVTTQQKFDDDRIVQILARFAKAGVSIIVCFNQFEDKHQELVDILVRSIHEKIGGEYGSDNILDIFKIPLLEKGEASMLSHHAEVILMREYILSCLANQSKTDVEKTLPYLTQQINDVLRPARELFSGISIWTQKITEGSEEMFKTYATMYLDNEEKYDAFETVYIYLINITDSETRGIRGGVSSVSKKFEVPRKVIWNQGKKLFRFAKKQLDNKEFEVEITNNDLKTLRAANRELIQSISQLIDDEINRETGNLFWANVGRRWGDKKRELERKFEYNLKAHWEATDRQIEDTAKEIYDILAQDGKSLKRLKNIATAADVVKVGGTLTIAFMTGGLSIFTLDPADMALEGSIYAIAKPVRDIVMRRETKDKIEPKKIRLKGYLQYSTEIYIQDNCEKPLVEIGESVMTDLIGNIDQEERNRIVDLPDRVRKMIG